MPHMRVLSPPRPSAGGVGELPTQTVLLTSPAWTGTRPGVGEPYWGTSGGPLLPPAIACIEPLSPVGDHMVSPPVPASLGPSTLFEGRAASLWIFASASGPFSISPWQEELDGAHLVSPRGVSSCTPKPWGETPPAALRHVRHSAMPGLPTQGCRAAGQCQHLAGLRQGRYLACGCPWQHLSGDTGAIAAVPTR